MNANRQLTAAEQKQARQVEKNHEEASFEIIDAEIPAIGEAMGEQLRLAREREREEAHWRGGRGLPITNKGIDVAVERVNLVDSIVDSILKEAHNSKMPTRPIMAPQPG